LEKYSFSGYPLVNGRGFGLKVSSQEEWLIARDVFLSQDKKKDEELLAKYLDFNAYRKIAIGGEA
jgi:hypothetical protein